MALESKPFPKPEGIATLEEARQIIATLVACIEHLESRLGLVNKEVDGLHYSNGLIV